MKNPGVSETMQSTVSFYRNESDEKKTAAINGIMSTVLRAWTNSVYHLIELLKHTKENFDGKYGLEQNSKQLQGTFRIIIF